MSLLPAAATMAIDAQSASCILIAAGSSYRLASSAPRLESFCRPPSLPPPSWLQLIENRGGIPQGAPPLRLSGRPRCGAPRAGVARPPCR